MPALAKASYGPFAFATGILDVEPPPVRQSRPEDHRMAEGPVGTDFIVVDPGDLHLDSKTETFREVPGKGDNEPSLPPAIGHRGVHRKLHIRQERQRRLALVVTPEIPLQPEREIAEIVCVRHSRSR